jgi:hypothetical protein
MCAEQGVVTCRCGFTADLQAVGVGRVWRITCLLGMRLGTIRTGGIGIQAVSC